MKKIKMMKQKVQVVLPPGQTPHQQYDIFKKAQFPGSEIQLQILHSVITPKYSSSSHSNALNFRPCIVK